MTAGMTPIEPLEKRITDSKPVALTVNLPMPPRRHLNPEPETGGGGGAEGSIP